MRHALLTLSLLSGAAGLVYEVVWMRWFRLLFGSTAYAASATLCAFFLGLAIGSALLGRAAGRTSHPLRLYAAVEAGAAAFALGVPLAVGAYDPIYAALYASLSDARVVFVAAKFALSLLAMLPCAVLLGGALPLLAAAYVRPGRQLGRSGSILYSANLLGGVAGAVLGGLVLPEWIGVGGAYAVGLAATLAAAAGALLLARGGTADSARGGSRDRVGSEDEQPAAALPAPGGALWIAGISGFGLLAFQVLLVHALARFIAHTVYSFGIVLVAVMSSLAAGAAFVALTERRLATRPLLRAALVLEGGLLLLLPWAVDGLRGAVRASEPLAALAASPLQQALLAVGALGVPSLLVAAVIFPLTFRLVSAGPAGPRLGGLLAINTLGGIAGSLMASFAMLEWLGLWGSFAGLGLVYGAAALAIANTPRQRLATAATVAFLVAAVAALPTNPWRMASAQPRDGERLLAQTEGAHGLVSVLERDGDRYIAIDEHYRFGSTRSAVLYERMGRLPLLLHPDPRRVLVVGSATGGLAAAAVLHPVDEIGLVEIVPEMHALAAAHFAETNRGVHTDPRTRLISEDGRNHLRAVAERYDVVIEDLFVPQRPTAAAMYTGEHYRDVRAHLSESGVFCQWLPIYQLSRTQLAMIVATFIDVFPDAALWTPSFRQPPILGLVASAGGPPSVEALAARGQQLERSGIEDAWLNDPDGLWAFYLGPAASLAEIAPAAALNSDARPRFEFVSARTPTIRTQRFASGGWPRLVGELLARADAEDRLFPGRPLALARAGQELARLNLLARSARSSLSREAWRQLEAQLPAHLLARRDPSVSNVWPDESR